MGTILRGEKYNPVVVQDQISRPQSNSIGRPTPRSMVSTYTYNVNVKKTDWSLPAMSIEKLLDDSIPFDPTIFISNEHMET